MCIRDSYFIWDLPEIEKLLGEDAEFATRVWNITEEGNFEDSNILHLTEPKQSLASELGLTEHAFNEKLDAVGDVLLNHRRSRVPPIRDEKILTGWNGLVITALAQAGMQLGRPDYIDAAIQAAEFLLTNNRRPVSYTHLTLPTTPYV